MEFSNKVKQLREAKGISQQKLADDIYVSRSAVAKWENGLGMPSKESQRLLCDYFEVSLEELINENDSSSVRKNIIIHKYNIIFVALVILIIGSITLSILLYNRAKKNINHIVYDHVPALKLNNIPTNYYQIGYEYVKQDDKYVLKNYVLTIPSKEILPNVSTFDRQTSLYIDTGMSCEYDVQYYYINDQYEFIDDHGGWESTKIYKVENVDDRNNIIYLDNIDWNNSIVLIISCNYKDLNVKYYYVIKK